MGGAPTDIHNGRIGPLARLPVFFALDGKRCIVAGGGPTAAWKAELLSATGARVDVFAPEPAEDMRALAIDPPQGMVTVHERAWQAADFYDASIAVGECEDDVEAAKFAAAARAAGVPVNVIDRPAFCDFSFGAIVNRSPLIIGISTDGAAPVFAQAIRARIETLIPKGFARWAEVARNWRPRVAALAPSFRSRRNFWERFADRAIARVNAAPTEVDFAALLAPGDAKQAGSVVLVDVGSDHPELLTLRAVRALRSADVILFDQWVSADIVDFARREARKMLVGSGSDATAGQTQDAGAVLIALAKAGRRVVQLRGDAAASANRADESIAAACRNAGISIEIVPSVTAARIAAGQPEAGPKAASPDLIRARA